MVRREVFQKTELFKSYPHDIDHDMWIRLSEVTKFHYLPNSLCAYRNHKGQRSLNRGCWEYGFSVLKDTCRRYPYGFNLKRKRMGVLYYRLAHYDWRHDDYFRGMKDYFLAGILEPFRAFDFIFNNKRC